MRIVPHMGHRSNHRVLRCGLRQSSPLGGSKLSLQSTHSPNHPVHSLEGYVEIMIDLARKTLPFIQSEYPPPPPLRSAPGITLVRYATGRGQRALAPSTLTIVARRR